MACMLGAGQRHVEQAITFVLPVAAIAFQRVLAERQHALPAGWIVVFKDALGTVVTNTGVIANAANKTFTATTSAQTALDVFIRMNTSAAVLSVYVFLVLFDAAFSYVRQRLMQICGGRLDARIGAAVHAHLLSLPLSVFETTAAGVLAFSSCALLRARPRFVTT